MQKVLLFDFDGTIADSFENFLQIAEVLAKKYGFPTISRDEVEKLRSEDARSLIKKLNIPFYKIPFLARDMKKMQKDTMSQIHPIEGLPEVLQELKKISYTMNVLTSNGEENVRLFLKNNSLDIFDHIYAEAGIFGKDAMIKKFLKMHHLQKEDILYIGDEIRDIHACKKAAIKIISVTWGFNSKEGLIKNSPDYLAETPSDLLKITALHNS